MKPKRTGIMGGTFNPIHMGHLIIAESAREQFHLDEVIFMPCGIPHLKSEENLLPKDVRTQMTRLAIGNNPFFNISTLEVDSEGITYTYKTLEKLHQINDNTDYYFIMGADSLWSIENWKEPARIFANCHILAAARGSRSLSEIEAQASYLNDKYAADILLIKSINIDISSTMIRDMIKNNESIRYLVPEAVYDFISKNKQRFFV